MANTSKWVLFLPPPDAYVRSFLYLLYTLIKLYYTNIKTNKTLYITNLFKFLNPIKITLDTLHKTSLFTYISLFAL